MRVLGNGNVISDGDSTPSFPDHTTFVTAVQSAGGTTRTFTVENTGTALLTTSSLTVPGGFTVTEGLSASIAAGNSDTFTVRLDDATVGVKSGDISFATNVTGKNPYNFAVAGEVVAAGAGPNEGDVIATFRSVGAGEHWVTPFGLPVPLSVNMTEAQAGALALRYPSGPGGTLYPLQVENFHLRRDGFVQFAAAHVKLPVGYVARAKCDIVYAPSFTQPSAPDWGAISTDFQANAAFFEPRVHWIGVVGGYGPWATPSLTRPEFCSGDVLTITITDDQGAPLVYSHTYDIMGFSYQDVGDYYGFNSTMLNQLARKITQDPAGRYHCYDPARQPVRIMPAGRQYVFGTDWRNGRFSVSGAYGDSAYSFAGHSSARRPKISAGSATEWDPFLAGESMPIYPRNRPGSNHDNYTVTFSVQRNGTWLPATSRGTIAHTRRRLNFKAKTAAFNYGDNYFGVRGLTSGAYAWVKQTVDNGATGHFMVERVDGPQFIDNELLVAEERDGTPRAGGATVDGALQFGTLTSSSGGSATLRSYGSRSNGQAGFYVTNITGTFNSGDTLTSSWGGTATQTGDARASDAAVCYDGVNTAQNGTLTPISDAVGRATQVGAWNSATPTPDSPWFSGRLVRQEERRIALNPRIDVFMRVTIDRDGNIIHREAVYENTKTQSASHSEWYDAIINVGGVNQVEGSAVHQHLYHPTRMTWRWRQAYQFGMCDPADFMRSGVIFGMYRYPEWDVRPHLRAMTRGKQHGIGDAFATDQTAFLTYVRETNQPLKQIGFILDASGGARPEHGEVNFWESCFWMGDSLSAWEEMEAFGDNGVGAMGFQHRYEQGTGEEAYALRDLYLRWNHHPHLAGAHNTYGGHEGRDSSNANAYPSGPRYHLVRPLDVSTSTSHVPGLGPFTCYLARPEKRFHDTQANWAWHLIAIGFNSQNHRVPKTGGVAGDVDHVMGYNNANGVRTFSRPTREIWKAAFCANVVGRRQRAMWLRVAGDKVKQANDVAERTWGGAFMNRATFINSNYPVPARWLPGDTLVDSGFPAIEGVRSTAEQVDGFKALYINEDCYQGHSMQVGDLTSWHNEQTWFPRLAALLKAETGIGSPWWWAVPGNVSGKAPYFPHTVQWNPNQPQAYPPAGGLAYDASIVGVTPSASTPIAADESGSHLANFIIANASDALVRDRIGANYGSDNSSLSAMADLYLKPGQPGYSIVKEFEFAAVAIEEYTTDPTLRDQCTALIEDIRAAASPDTLVAGSAGNLETAKYWAPLAIIRRSEVVSW